MDITLFYFIPWGILLFLGVHRLVMKPINQRYQRAMNRLFAKQIARSLYQNLHPEFTYDNRYHPDDCQSQLILSEAQEEFQRLQNNANTIVKD